VRKWMVQDRRGREIYLTEERWKHIVEWHDELDGRLDDVLNTLKQGRRKQEVRDPQRYRYRYPYDDLLYGYNHIVVVVVFSYRQLPNGSTESNNFVTTAWGQYIPE